MMGRLRWWVLVLAVLLAAAPLAAQADAPLYLAIEGELMRVTASGAALEPVAACAPQPGERIFGAPVMSPDGTLIALRLEPALVSEARERVGGWGGGENPSDIVICDPASGIIASFSQPEDAALFDPAGRPDTFTVRSAPAWSIDGTGLAWTECAVGCDTLRVMVFDLNADSAGPIAALPPQYGVPVSVPVAWGGPLILVYSIGFDPVSLVEDARMLGFDPATGDTLLDVPVVPETANVFSFIMEFFWIDAGADAPQIALLLSSGAWYLLDPATSERTLMTGVPEQVSIAAPEGLATVADARMAQASNLRWLVRDGETLTLLGDDVRGFQPPAIAPDGGALVYSDNLTPVLWRNGASESLPLPPLSPGDPAHAAWGYGIWRIYSGSLPPAEAGFVCFGAPPPRLAAGTQAVVVEEQGDNNLRAEPDTTATLLGVIPAGRTVDVTDGPVCADGYAWWQVTYGGQTGWTAEGEGSTYWLQPAG